MKTTITDVAKYAKVSMKTVSRVLNNEPNVAKTTRDRVLQAAKELRYSPNLAAKGLASSKSYLIALLYDNPSPNYIANIQKGAIKACRDNNYYLVIEPLSMVKANAGDEVEKLLERINRRIDTVEHGVAKINYICNEGAYYLRAPHIEDWYYSLCYGSKQHLLY